MHVPTLILLSYWRPKPNGASQELDDSNDNNDADDDERVQKFAHFRMASQTLLYPSPTPPTLLFDTCKGLTWQPAPIAPPISKSARKGLAAKTLSPKVAPPYFRTHVAGHFCDYHLPLAATSPKLKAAKTTQAKKRGWHYLPSFWGWPSIEGLLSFGPLSFPRNLCANESRLI